MDADCPGHVRMIAGAGRPIPYEAIVSGAHDDRGRTRTAKPGDAGAYGVKLREGKAVQPDGEVVKTFAQRRVKRWDARAERLAYAVKSVVQGKPDVRLLLW